MFKNQNLNSSRMLKGPIPFVSVFNVNQKPTTLELMLIVKPQGRHILLSEIRQCIHVLCNSLSN